MLERGNAMFTLRYFKKCKFLKSQRNYTDDYSYHQVCPIDMTLSGRFLLKRKKEIVDARYFDQYPPQLLEEKLKIEIAKKYNLLKDNIILGCGCNGILQNLIKIFFNGNGNIVLPFYSFSQPEYAVNSFGSYAKRVYCMEDYHINFREMKNAVDKNTEAIFIANPNNPTGIYEDPLKIIKLAKSVKVPVIVSEAGIEFAQNKSLLEFDCPNNLIVIRSFSKAFGLSGLRIGFALLPYQYKKLYLENITKFEVSSLSMVFALKFINSALISKNVYNVIQERQYLENSLNKLKIPMIPSNSNILMSKKSYPDDFFLQLSKLGIAVVKILDEMGKNHFRIAVQDQTVNRKFISKMKGIKL